MNRKGFTLIEVMVCIIILTIMGFMATTIFFGITAFNNAKNNSNAVIIQQQDEFDKNESVY